jgi:hypothetical protein
MHMSVQHENMAAPYYTIDNIGNAQVGRLPQSALPLPAQTASMPPFIQQNYPAPPLPNRSNMPSQTGMQSNQIVCPPLPCNCPVCSTARQSGNSFPGSSVPAFQRSMPMQPAPSNGNVNPQSSFLNNGPLQGQPVMAPQIHSISPPIAGSAFATHNITPDNRLGLGQIQYESLGIKPNQFPQLGANPSSALINPMQAHMARSDTLDFLNHMPQPMPQPLQRYPASVGPQPMMGPPPVMRNPMLDFGKPNNALIPYSGQLVPRAPMMGPPMIQAPGAMPQTMQTMPIMAPPVVAPPKTSVDELANELGFLNITSEAITPPATPLTSKSLRDIQNDLVPLAKQISPTTNPFDTTGTIVTAVCQSLGLPYSHEWRASIRSHSCTPF